MLRRTLPAGQGWPPPHAALVLVALLALGAAAGVVDVVGGSDPPSQPVLPDARSQEKQEKQSQLVVQAEEMAPVAMAVESTVDAGSQRTTQGVVAEGATKVETADDGSTRAVADADAKKAPLTGDTEETTQKNAVPTHAYADVGGPAVAEDGASWGVSEMTGKVKKKQVLTKAHHSAVSAAKGPTSTLRRSDFVLDPVADPEPERWVFLRSVWQYFSLGAVLKVACVLSNLLSQASPYPTIRKFEAAGNTGECDALAFVAIGFNGAQWCFYGLFAWILTENRGFLVVVYANILGAVAGYFYTATFHRLCRSYTGSKALIRYCKGFAFLTVLQASVVMLAPLQTALVFSGFMAASCGAVVAVSQLVTLPTVFRTKSAASMSGELAISNFTSSVLWLVCGVMLVDWWIILPNVVGVCAGFVALSTILMFGTGPGKCCESTRLITGNDGNDGCTGGTNLAYTHGCAGGTADNEFGVDVLY